MVDYCEVDGLLVMDGEGYWMRLPAVALVTDCNAWRRADKEGERTAATQTEQDADKAHSGTQEIGTGGRGLFRRLSAHLDGAEERQAPLPAELVRALYRLHLQPQHITRQTLHEYLCQLLRHVIQRVPKGIFVPAFLFNVDLPTPTLWGTDDVDLALRYCSGDLLSVRESRAKLKRRVAVVMLELTATDSLTTA